MEIKANDIKNAIKAEGIDTKKISVSLRQTNNGDTYITVTIKDIEIKIAKVEAIVKKFRETERDEKVQSEVLEGGNVIINCDYDYDTREKAVEANEVEAERVYNLLSEKAVNGEVIASDDDYTYYAFKKIGAIKAVSKKNEPRFKCPQFTMENFYDLAESMIFIPELSF